MKRLWLWVSFFVLAGVWPSQVYAEVLVSTNSTWRFRKGTREASSPPNAGRAVAFDDSSWGLGVAPFSSDTDSTSTGNTRLGVLQKGYTCIFIRQKFSFSTFAAIAALPLRP